MVYLHSVETSVPPGAFPQKEFAVIQDRLLSDAKMRRYAESIYADSGIERRHSVVIEPGNSLSSPFFGVSTNRLEPRNPGSAERNQVFSRTAPALVCEAAQKALEASGFSAEEVTHIVTVTCTGFFNPGPDIALVKKLQIRPAVHRYQLGFMGCNAAFPAMNMAKQFCEADPGAVVLAVCFELCSLHLSMDSSLDAILGNSLFSDGAAAVVISARDPRSSVTCRLKGFHSMLLPDGFDDMAWKVGDHGFDIVLSRYVPRIIGANISGLVSSVLARLGISPSLVAAWAVHPGGKSILDKVQNSLQIPPAGIEASRAVLRNFGNMSSPTVLFALKEILERKPAHSSKNIFAMAFGPGLTVETGLMELM